MARIELEDVDLTFNVRKFGKLPLKDMIVNMMFRKSVNPVIEVEALKNICLDIRDGDRIGIIGRNGAGKSTMLKVLAGIYQPTTGKRLVEGRVSSLFDIGLGFELDGTGWDNIYYRGYLLRQTPATMRAKAKEIAEFTELGDALNMPIRYYSAGMMVRLAFSISTAIEPEILLIDEVLGAGDAGFLNKARQRMRNLMQRARLMVMVSHDMAALANICDKLIWLDKGEIRAFGPVKATTDAYLAHVNPPPPTAAKAA